MTAPCGVIDGFLTEAEHRALWDGFRQDSASGARDWNRVYRLMGGTNPALDDATIEGSHCPPALRAFTEKLFALMTGAAPVAIAKWTGFSQSAWVYRRGQGLEWHSDTGWLGAYIYYMHPAWGASWGGELLVADDASHSAGRFIRPVPNRLVVMRGGTFHCINPVARAAGDCGRTSISGFFFDTIFDAGHAKTD
ncbi:MAG: 2OG-Fe(II) oxygenase [Rhizomicrobium sp.]